MPQHVAQLNGHQRIEAQIHQPRVAALQVLATASRSTFAHDALAHEVHQQLDALVGQTRAC